MKQKPKAPWFIDPGISADERWVNQVESALGLCHGCIHTKLDTKRFRTGQYGIEITCKHPKRQEPGLGLSTDEACPYKTEVTSEDPELEKLYKGPLEACPDCNGKGFGPYPAAGLPAPCNTCFGTGAIAHEVCPRCNDTGVWETGNNDFPCDCPAGNLAEFNVAGRGIVSGATLKAEQLARKKGPTEFTYWVCRPCGITFLPNEHPVRNGVACCEQCGRPLERIR